MPLKPLEVYMCVLELMSVLSQLEWTRIIPLAMELSGDEISTEIVVHPFPPTTMSRLQARYAVLGLYAVGLAIAEGNQFLRLDAAIYLNDLEVGWIDIRPKRLQRLSSRSSFALDLTSTNGTAMVTADSGRVIDPDDKKYALSFTWDGVRIKAQDIFTTLLDALAIAAQHNNTDFDAHVPVARSASGDTVLSTWTVAREGEGGPQMTWRLLKRALIMIWDMLIIAPMLRAARFEGLTFDIEYEGVRIGSGRMLRFDSEKGDAGGGMNAVAKRRS